MSTENIVTGKYYRILKNATSKAWDRISFWTHADDVELSSGATLSSDLTAKQTKIDATQSDFAQVETSPSTHAYTKGQMLIYNNQLYRVKAAIAVGNTLTVGTNIELVSVSTLSSMLTANTGNAFYFDVKDGAYGFYPTASKTASTFVPFGGTTLTLVASNVHPSNVGYNQPSTQTVDCTSVPNYSAKTSDDFILSINSVIYTSGDSSKCANISTALGNKSYDASTGTLTIKTQAYASNGNNMYIGINVDVYCK